jgi:hypothetical protein
MRIGQRNDRGVVQDDESFKVKGSSDGIEAYRKRQLAAFDRFERQNQLSPTVQASLHINRAVTALHLKDLKLLRKEVDALEALARRESVDRQALEIDKDLAVFERVLAGEWLLEDPCG